MVVPGLPWEPSVLVGPDQLRGNNFRVYLADHDQVVGVGDIEQVAAKALEYPVHHRPDPGRSSGAHLLPHAVQAGLRNPVRQAVRDHFGEAQRRQPDRVREGDIVVGPTVAAAAVAPASAQDAGMART